MICGLWSQRPTRLNQLSWVESGPALRCAVIRALDVSATTTMSVVSYCNHVFKTRLAKTTTPEFPLICNWQWIYLFMNVWQLFRSRRNKYSEWSHMATYWSYCANSKKNCLAHFLKNLYILPRDAMHKRGLCRHAVSVSLSVRLSRSWIMSKRINISSKFFHHRVATPF